MRILDMLKRATQTRQLVLDEAASSQWSQQLIEHRGLEKEYKAFNDAINQLTEDIRKSLLKFTDEDVLATVPDRARTMNALHGSEYASQVNKLLATTQFTDLFTFEKQQDAYFEMNSSFKTSSTKNANVLKEFLLDELKATQTLLQKLEDTIIHFTKTLEDKGFPQIRKIHESNLKLQKMTELEGKYRQLVESLEVDRKRTQEKRAKLEDEIKAQTALVRNDASLQALEKIKKIDQELFTLAAQYTAVCQDILTVYKKNTDLELKPLVKKTLEAMPKDPLSFISTNAELLKQTFEGVLTQFEDERPGNVKSVVERTARLVPAIEQDSRKIQTSAPDERALKREMMKDIAALNIYDKQQFLMRARIEEEAIDHKLSYLAAELDPQKKAMLVREMKEVARALGAAIKNAEIEPPEIEPEHEDAALK